MNSFFSNIKNAFLKGLNISLSNKSKPETKKDISKLNENNEKITKNSNFNCKL